jgi:3-oxoacyl-[acyl-carrier-protein] synthase-3
MSGIGLTGVGAFVPEPRLTNADLEKMVDTTDEWIRQRTGIRERRKAPSYMFASDMAVEAARNCLSKSEGFPDLLVSSSGTNERVFPYQASIVAERLALPVLPAFDINAACSGFIYGMAAAKGLMEMEGYKKALVTASEKMTYFTDYSDRSSCILFGDGAAAVTLERDAGHRILCFELGLDGTGSRLVRMGERDGNMFFWQDGAKVFKFAVNKATEILEKLLKKADATREEKRLHVILHQANYRIIESVAKSSGIPMDQFVVNLDRFGNTSSASIGLALEESWGAGRFQKDDLLLMIGFGGGLSWAGVAVRW